MALVLTICRPETALSAEMLRRPARRVLTAEKGGENGNATNDQKNVGRGRNKGQPEPGFEAFSVKNLQLTTWATLTGLIRHFEKQRCTFRHLHRLQAELTLWK